MKCGCHSHNGLLLKRSPEGLAQRGYPGHVQDNHVSAVDRPWDEDYLDEVGSVSALVEVEDHWVDAIIDQQYRRFLHGTR